MDWNIDITILNTIRFNLINLIIKLNLIIYSSNILTLFMWSFHNWFIMDESDFTTPNRKNVEEQEKDKYGIKKTTLTPT